MRHIATGKQRGKFDLLWQTRSLQAAMMTLKPGDKSDDEPSNEHPRSEQWLFVVSGTGQAIAMKGKSRRKTALRKNSLLVIEKAERHQIVNTGRRPLVTVNFYAPPAYGSSGYPR